MVDGGSPNPVGTYLYATSAITVLALKRHVIPSNEIFVTLWVSRILYPSSNSPSALSFYPSLSPYPCPLPIPLPLFLSPTQQLLSLVPYNITIANSPAAVALCCSKARPIVKVRTNLPRTCNTYCCSDTDTQCLKVRRIIVGLRYGSSRISYFDIKPPIPSVVENIRNKYSYCVSNLVKIIICQLIRKLFLMRILWQW